MIKIEFTCYVCGKVSKIGVDDIGEKEVVPVCDDCYKKFISLKEKRIKSFIKNIKRLYRDYNIPFDTFNVSEEITVEDSE